MINIKEEDNTLNIEFNFNDFIDKGVTIIEEIKIRLINSGIVEDKVELIMARILSEVGEHIHNVCVSEEYETDVIFVNGQIKVSEKLGNEPITLNIKLPQGE
jgi:hypothetical protein